MLLAAAFLVAGCGGSQHAQTQQASASPTQSVPSSSVTVIAPVAPVRHHRKRVLRGDPLTRIGTVSSADGGPSGVRMPIGNLPGWRQIYADDFPASQDTPIGKFTGCTFSSDTCSGLSSAAAAKWFAYPDGVPDTWGGGQYTPSQVLSIHGGLLDFKIHTSSESGVHEVAAVVPRIDAAPTIEGMLHGAYAVRFRAATLPGYEVAWQLYPDSHNGNGLSDGEIGFPAGPLSGSVMAWLHWPNATSEEMNYTFATRASFSRWHTAVLEWNPKLVRFILDGKTVATVTHHLPTVPMFWVLQTEVEEAPNLPSASVAGHVDVAWATAYAWDPK